MYGDPRQVYALAREVERREDELRRRVRELRDAGRRTVWSSTAGDTHRKRLEDDLRDAERCADQLAEAAEALRAHARVVQQRLEAIANAEREVREWFGRAQQAVRSKVASAVNFVGDLVDDVTPWDGWRWTPSNLPLPGHLDWLDAADLVRGRR